MGRLVVKAAGLLIESLTQDGNFGGVYRELLALNLQFLNDRIEPAPDLAKECHEHERLGVQRVGPVVQVADGVLQLADALGLSLGHGYAPTGTRPSSRPANRPRMATPSTFR